MPISGGGSGGGSGFNNRGAWSAAINYAINDVVTYNGSTYLCLVANSAVTPDSNATDWQIWAQRGTDGTNGTNGTNGTSTGNALLTGGRAIWTSGYNFTVSAASYIINGAQYSSAQSNITLSASDPTNDRIDVIAVNTSGAVVIVAGTAAAAPAKPDIDPTTQLELTFIYVAATSTQPTISSTVIYDEGTEWTASVSGTGMTLNSTNSPFHGTKCIEATAVAANAYAQFVNASTFDIATKPNIVVYLKSKAAWPSSKTLTLAWYKGSTRVGNLVTVKDGTFGFNSGVTSNYQQIVIPTALFAANGLQVDTLRVTVVGSGGSIGFYLDDISLQSGVTQTSSNQAMIWRGAWSSTVSYNVNDVVSNSNALWIAAAPNINSTPSLSNANWNQELANSGIATWTTKTSNYTAVAGDKILADTSGGAFTITLPASPSVNDEIRITDTALAFNVNNLTVALNGNLMNGFSSNLSLSTNGVSVTLTYSGSTYGWVETSSGTYRPNAAAWNSNDKSPLIQLSNGNRDSSLIGTGWASARGDRGNNSGKLYFEVKVLTSGTAVIIGLGDSTMSLASYPGATADSWSVNFWGTTQYGSSGSASGVWPSVAVGDVVGIAVDFTAGTAKFYKNGVLAVTWTATAISSHTLYPAIGYSDNSTTARISCYASQFAYSIPSGYSAWSV